MKVAVAKWGNSLAIRISKPLAEQIQIQEGTNVTVKVVDGSLVITPQNRKKYTLAELLAGMNPDKFHAEVDMGNSMGNEF